MPQIKLPQTTEGWSEADKYMKEAVVPGVLHEIDVNSMNHVLNLGIYSCFTTKYGVQEPNQHPNSHNKVQR